MKPGRIIEELCETVTILAKLVEEQHEVLEQLDAVAAAEGYETAKKRYEALMGDWPGDTDGTE